MLYSLPEYIGVKLRRSGAAGMIFPVSSRPPWKVWKFTYRRVRALPSKHEFQKTQVECRSRYKADEYPVAFVFEGARLEAAEIVDRWYEGGLDPEQPVIDYFRVRSEDGRIFMLKYPQAIWISGLSAE